MNNKLTKTKGIILCVILIILLGMVFNYYDNHRNTVYMENAEIQIIDKGELKTSLNMKKLEALNPVELKATINRSVLQSPKEYTYTGIPLKEILEFAEIMPSDNELLFLISKEGYEVSFTREELQKNKNIVLFYKRDGKYSRDYTSSKGKDAYMLMYIKEPISEIWEKYIYKLEVRENN